MHTTKPDIKIISGINSETKDSEIQDLLTKVYVDGGFIEQSDANSIFSTGKVRDRGVLIGAYDTFHSMLVGIIVYVPYNSPAIKLANTEPKECEFHLLAVTPEYRCLGIAGLLVDKAIKRAKGDGCSKIILWTQNAMENAQKLYDRHKFLHISDIYRNNKDYKIYELEIIQGSSD